MQASDCSKTRLSRGSSEHTASLKPCSERAQETPVSNPPFPEAGESIQKKSYCCREKKKILHIAEGAYFFLFVYQQNPKVCSIFFSQNFPILIVQRQQAVQQVTRKRISGSLYECRLFQHTVTSSEEIILTASHFVIWFISHQLNLSAKIVCLYKCLQFLFWWVRQGKPVAFLIQVMYSD